SISATRSALTLERTIITLIGITFLLCCWLLLGLLSAPERPPELDLVGEPCQVVDANWSMSWSSHDAVAGLATRGAAEHRRLDDPRRVPPFTRDDACPS